MKMSSSNAQLSTTSTASTSPNTGRGSDSTVGGRGSDGTGQGGGRRHERGRGCGRGNRGNNRSTTSNSSFRGETKEMNGNVFKCHEESRDPTQFNRTLEALERYANKTYTILKIFNYFLMI